MEKMIGEKMVKTILLKREFERFLLLKDENLNRNLDKVLQTQPANVYHLIRRYAEFGLVTKTNTNKGIKIDLTSKGKSLQNRLRKSLMIFNDDSTLKTPINENLN